VDEVTDLRSRFSWSLRRCKVAKNSVTILMVAVVRLGLVFAGGCESDAQTGAGLGAAAGIGIGAIMEALAERHYLREEMNTVMVRVTNSNGSVVRVPLRKQGVGYVGTRGEYYPTLPTEGQLRPVYGF
jgi:hypothetical protein